jgi:1,4-alpha-glucan branching enzyme
MALKKKYLKSKPICKVSFQLTEKELENPQSVELLGSFSDWQPVAMRKVKGSFTRTVDLKTGAQHQFKYRVNGQNWLNDPAADAYVANTFSTENSVVSL